MNSVLFILTLYLNFNFILSLIYIYLLIYLFKICLTFIIAPYIAQFLLFNHAINLLNSTGSLIIISNLIIKTKFGLGDSGNI